MVVVQGKEDSNEDVFAEVHNGCLRHQEMHLPPVMRTLGQLKGGLQIALMMLKCNYFLMIYDVHIDVAEDDIGNVSKWKESLPERTLSRKTPSLMQLVYEESTINSTSINKENDNSEDDESEDDFFKPIEEVKKSFIRKVLTIGERNGRIMGRGSVDSLVSGLLSNGEITQDYAFTGVGLLVGSSILLLTVVWGSCVIVGSEEFKHDSGSRISGGSNSAQKSLKALLTGLLHLTLFE